MSCLGQPVATRVYELYGRFYDLFQMIFKRRLGRAIGGVPLHSGDRVLDIGVGTGLSLEFYPEHVRVTGVDLSVGMLRQAQRKLDEGHVRAGTPRDQTHLLQADALQLPFADGSFDIVVLAHVVSTVPDPARCMAEAFRVARDRAYIVLLNHFRSPYPVMNWLESAIDPICRKLGWRCDLSLEELLEGMNVRGIRRLRPQGFVFRTVYLQKASQGLHVVPPPALALRQLRLRTA